MTYYAINGPVGILRFSMVEGKCVATSKSENHSIFESPEEAWMALFKARGFSFSDPSRLRSLVMDAVGYSLVVLNT